MEAKDPASLGHSGRVARLCEGTAESLGLGRREIQEVRTADIVAANPDKVEQAKAKPAAVQWFVGQVMKSSGGKADPKAVNALLKSKLGI